MGYNAGGGCRETYLILGTDFERVAEPPEHADLPRLARRQGLSGLFRGLDVRTMQGEE